MAADRGVAVPYKDIVKHDAHGTARDVWHAPGVVGEPCFIPRLGRASVTEGAEDDGWVLVQMYDHVKCQTDYVILDAQKLGAGPVCTLHVGHHIPYAFHGTFTPNVFTHPPSKVSKPRKPIKKLAKARL